MLFWEGLEMVGLGHGIILMGTTIKLSGTTMLSLSLMENARSLDKKGGNASFIIRKGNRKMKREERLCGVSVKQVR